MPTFSARCLGPTLAACAAGVLLAVIYTLSPMTIWFGLVTIAIFGWAGHGLTGRERVWIFRILFLAVALRLLALIAFFLVTYQVDGSLPLLIGDESYIQHRSLWLRSVALRLPIPPNDYAELFGSFGESGLLYFFAYLQLQLGQAPYAIRLFNVLLYLASAVTLYRTVRPTFGAPAALGGLGVVLFLPSLFAWSISALKEPGYLFFMAISLAAATAALRANTLPARMLAVITCLIALLGVETMRAGAGMMVGGGIIAGVLLATVIRRPVLLPISLLIGIVVGSHVLQDRRFQEQAKDLLQSAVIRHIGNVMTPGRGYKLLDPELYIRRDLNTYTRALEPDVVGRYLIRAAASIVLVPLPWRLESATAVAYLPEQIVWYVLVVLAAVGSLTGIRRDAPVTCLFLGVIVLSAAAIALTSGNVGTMIRHRTMVIMPLVWLSSIGACTLLKQLATRYQFQEGVRSVSTCRS